MIIKIVNVIFQVVVTPDTPTTEVQHLWNMLDSQEDDTQTLYDAANQHVAFMLENHKHFGLACKNKRTPVHDFDIHVEFTVVREKALQTKL